MSELGPFAIRRIEPGASPGSTAVPASNADAAALALLKRATEVAANRVTGQVERASPADAQLGETIRAQSAAIGAATWTPLLDSLSGPPVLAMPASEPDPLAPATGDPRDGQSPPIDPSADAMRTSVFHPLADLPATRDPGVGGEATTRTPGHVTGRLAEQLHSLLDRFLPATSDRGRT